MNSTNTYPVPADFINKTNLNAASYHALYQQSIVSPEQFGLSKQKNLSPG
jgi:hypothetical protein